MVMCGPPEALVHLKKPLVLTIPHCASLMHGNWSVTVMQSDEILDNSLSNKRASNNGNLCLNSNTNWQRVVTLGHETINTPVYAQLDVNACHLVIDSLATFCLVGESASRSSSLKSKGSSAVKCLRLAAFAQEGPAQPADLTMRVYCLPDTDDALAYVSETERRYNGRLLDKPISVSFSDTGDDLCLNVDDLNSFWSCQQGADYLEMPFGHVWSCSNPSLHCSFTFRPSRERANANPSSLSLTVSIWQKQSNGNNPKCSLLNINSDLSHRSSNLLHTYINSNANNNIPSPYGTTPADSGRFRISSGMMASLSRLLDQPNSKGNDWRLLAERLNVHRYVNFFATRPSPTEAILVLWEARNRELLALSNLMNTLRGMGRFDAAAVLEQDLDIR